MATNDDIDLHRLDLRVAPARVIVPGAVAALVRSIEQSGQLVPCITVSEADGSGLILIDGYRRIEALRRLGRDTARIETWTCSRRVCRPSSPARGNGRWPRSKKACCCKNWFKVKAWRSGKWRGRPDAT